MSAVDVIGVSVQWYLVATLYAIAVLPWVMVVFKGLRDRGVTIARPIGLALIPLPLWIIGNLVIIPFNARFLIAITLLIGGSGWYLAVRRYRVLATLRDRWRWLVVSEIATLLLFSLYVGFRGFYPDIAGTEKPMELAFLNAAINGGQLPLEDPWFAGETINYYYLGYVALASVAIVSNVPGEIAFNLGLATVFAGATVAAAGLAANLASAIDRAGRTAIAGAGVIAGFMVSAAGNLHGTWSFLQDPGGTARASWWGGIGWGSSRIVEDTGFDDGGTRTVITEFPAFSWILGDLHPHVIAYPWLIATLALIANMFLICRDPGRNDVTTAALSTGIGLGVLYSANTWDLPVAGMLAIVALAPLLHRHDWRVALQQVIVIGAGTLLAAGTFMLSYDSPTGGDTDSPIPVVGGLVNSLGYVSWDRTPAPSIAEHWGVFLVLLGVVTLAFLLRWRDAGRHRWTWFALGVVLLSILSLLTSGTPALLLFGVPALVIAIHLIVSQEELDASAIPAGFILIALLALCAMEFVFIEDPFGDRMNTVFKLSFQAWAILSIGLAALVPATLKVMRHQFSNAWMVAPVSILAIAIAASAVYTPVSAYQWADQRPGWNGLDGIEHIERAHPDERAAISWLNQTDEPVDIVLEAPGCAYGSDNVIPHNRISMATGIPTVIGWDGHQSQWRRGQPELLGEIRQRIEFVQQAYEQPDTVNWYIGDRQISHIVVGQHELSGYQQCEHGPPYAIPEDEHLAEAGWEIAFERGRVTIFRVDHQDAKN